MRSNSTSSRKRGVHTRMRGRRAEEQGRIDRWVELQQQAAKRWGVYAVTVTSLWSNGNLNPREWSKEFAQLWSGLAEDMGNMTRLMFPREER